MSTYFMLPKPPRPFVGRRELISELSSAIEEECVIILEGIRGIGKTGIMLKLADSLLSGTDLDSGSRKVFWLDLYPGITRNDFIKSVMAIMESRGITFSSAGMFDSNSIETGKDNLLGQVIFALNRFPVVFFVDNAENIPMDERTELVSFFGQYLRSSTFVFSSNETLIDLDSDLCLETDFFLRRLPPFNKDEAMELLVKTVKRHGISISKNDITGFFDKIIEITQGLPLTVKILANTLKEQKGVLEKISFSDLLTPPESMVMTALCIIGIPVPLDSVKKVLGPEKMESVKSLRRKFFLELNGFGALNVNQNIHVHKKSSSYSKALELACLILKDALVHSMNKVRDKKTELWIGCDFEADFSKNPLTSALWMKYSCLMLDREADNLTSEIMDILLFFGRWLFFTNSGEVLQKLKDEIINIRKLKISDLHPELVLLFIHAECETSYTESTETMAENLRIMTDDPMTLSALDLFLGISFASSKRKKMGIELLERAEKKGTFGIKAIAMRTRACVLLDSGNFSEMKKIYSDCIDLCRKNELKNEMMKSIFESTAMDIHLGNFQDAEMCIEKFLGAEKKSISHKLMAEIYALKAFILLKKNRISESLAASEKSLELSKKCGLSVIYHMVLSNHAQALTLMDQFDRAMAEYNQCLSFVYEIGDFRGIPIIINNISQACYRKGDLSSSAKYLNQALEMSKNNENKKNIGLGHVNLASLYLSMGRIQDASDTLDKAIEEIESIGLHNDLARARIIRGEIFIAMQKTDLAWKTLLTTREFCKKRGYILNEIKCLSHMGVVRIMQYQPEHALSLLDKSIILSIRNSIFLKNLFNFIFFLILLKGLDKRGRFEKFRTIYLETAEKNDPSKLDKHKKIADLLSSNPPCKELSEKIKKVVKDMKWEILSLLNNQIMTIFTKDHVQKIKNQSTQSKNQFKASSETDKKEKEYRLWISDYKDKNFREADEEKVAELRRNHSNLDLFADFSNGYFYSSAKGEIALTRKRALLPVIKHLAANPGKRYTISGLYEEVWHGEFDKTQAAVIHVNIQRLRKLIEEDAKQPRLILTGHTPEGEGCYYLSTDASIAVIFSNNS